MIKKLSITLMLSGIFLMIVSCEDKNEIESDLCQIIETIDSTIVSMPSICDSLETGEITFEYKDSIYSILDPLIEVIVDTFQDNYNPTLYYKYLISIRGPINENQDLLIGITHYDTIRNNCLPIMKFFELNSSTGEKQCFDLEEEFGTYPICSRMTGHIVTFTPVYTISYASEGSLSILDCENGDITGVFENDFFKNGQFCNLVIE